MPSSLLTIIKSKNMLTIFVVAAATAGVLLLVSSEAATFTSGTEAETGTKKGSVGTYSETSGGETARRSFVEFYDPTQYAIGHVYGYLWSDGSNLTTTPLYRTTSKKQADRYEASARKLASTIPGASVTLVQPYPYDNPNDNNSSLYYRITLHGFGLNIPLDRIPDAIANSSRRNKQAFVMSVIEGEGTGGGLVIDDPSLAHANAFKDLLSSLSLHPYFANYDNATDTCTPFTGDLTKRNFFHLCVEKQDAAVLQGWPFATFGRVPR